MHFSAHTCYNAIYKHTVTILYYLFMWWILNLKKSYNKLKLNNKANYNYAQLLLSVHTESLSQVSIQL
jgi:HD superfamily phosphohydrolase